MTCYFSDTASVQKRWYQTPNDPASGPAPWSELLSRSDPEARGFSLSIAARNSYRGKLALQIAYTDRNAMMVEVDVQKQSTIWVPGSSFRVAARLEAPIDRGITNAGVAPLTEYPISGSVDLDICAYREVSATQRSLVRSYTFANPLALETFEFPIPRGAYGFHLGRSDLSPRVTPNIDRISAVWLKNENPDVWKPLVDYTDLALQNPFVGTPYAQLPNGASHIQVVGGNSPNPLVWTMMFLIQL